MAIAKGLAAKARLTKDNGTKIYIEVRDGSNFHDFFTTYTMQGIGRGRVIIPGIPRHRGLPTPLRMQPRRSPGLLINTPNAVEGAML